MCVCAPSGVLLYKHCFKKYVTSLDKHEEVCLKTVCVTVYIYIYICYFSLCSPETRAIPSTLCNAATMRHMFFSKRLKTYGSGKTTQSNRSLLVTGRATCCPLSISMKWKTKSLKASGLTRRAKRLLHDKRAHNEIREKPCGHSAVST